MSSFLLFQVSWLNALLLLTMSIELLVRDYVLVAVIDRVPLPCKESVFVKQASYSVHLYDVLDVLFKG